MGLSVDGIVLPLAAWRVIGRPAEGPENEGCNAIDTATVRAKSNAVSKNAFQDTPTVAKALQPSFSGPSAGLPMTRHAAEW